MISPNHFLFHLTITARLKKVLAGSKFILESASICLLFAAMTAVPALHYDASKFIFVTIWLSINYPWYYGLEKTLFERGSI